MHGHEVKKALVLETRPLIEALSLPKLRLVIDGRKINFSDHFACDAQGRDLSGQSQFQSNAALLPCRDEEPLVRCRRRWGARVGAGCQARISDGMCLSDKGWDHRYEPQRKSFPFC